MTLDILALARLARLKLTPAETRSLGADIAGIIRYVNILQAVPAKLSVDKAAPLAARLDRVYPWDEAERETALKQAPRRHGRQIKVNRILA